MEILEVLPGHSQCMSSVPNVGHFRISVSRDFICSRLGNGEYYKWYYRVS